MDNPELDKLLEDNSAHDCLNLDRINKQKLEYPRATLITRGVYEAMAVHIDPKKEGMQMLEVGSGSGQHSAYFADRFKNLTIQPSEFNYRLFTSINAYAATCFYHNMKRPIYLEVARAKETYRDIKLPPESFDYMYHCNMTQILQGYYGVFFLAKMFLKHHGLLFIYGPFVERGAPEEPITPLSRKMGFTFGIRDYEQFHDLAKTFDLKLKSVHEMEPSGKFIALEKQHDDWHKGAPEPPATCPPPASE